MNAEAMRQGHAALPTKAQGIYYGVIGADYISRHSHNYACHKDIAYEAPGVLAVWSHQQAAERNPDYVTWLQTKDSPWGTLRKEYNSEKHGWVIPSDQPANLILNFLIGTRSATDDQTGWSIQLWRSLRSAGVGANLAYAFTYMVAPNWDANTFFLKRSDTNHDVMQIEHYTANVLLSFCLGLPDRLSALYVEHPDAVLPCCSLWGPFNSPRCAPYSQFIEYTYLRGKATKTKERSFYRPGSSRWSAPGTLSYPISLLTEVATAEQRRIGL